MGIVRVEVTAMRCSDGNYYTSNLVNDAGELMELHMTKTVGHANYGASEYAKHCGVPLIPAKAIVLEKQIHCPFCTGTGTSSEEAIYKGGSSDLSILGCRPCSNTGVLTINLVDVQAS